MNLEEARAWIDAAVAGDYLDRTTGSQQLWAFWVLEESDDPADVSRALAIRAIWNAERDRWAGWGRVAG